MAFADHYPLAHFQAACAAEKDPKIAPSVQDHRKNIFVPALRAHLLELRAVGRLQPTSGIKGRRIWQASAWNKFLAGEDPHQGLINWLGQFIHISAVMDAAKGRMMDQPRYTDGDMTAEAISGNWHKLCEALDTGNTNRLYWRLDSLFDSKTGTRCELQIKNWKAQIMVLNAKYDLVPIKNAPAVPLVTAEFDMPTGAMLLTDTLRIKGFSKGIEFNDDDEYGKYELGNDLSEARRISGHAEEHGFGFTQTTNTCVVVHRHPTSGRIIVSARWNPSERGEDKDGDAAAPGWEKVGTFSCDIWRVTAIDKQTAVARMIDGGCEAHRAETALDTYLASNDAYAENIVRLDVQPGRWRIHSGPDFTRRVKRDRFDIPKGIRPWLLLEPVPAG